MPRYGQERTHQLTLTTWVGLLKWGIAEQIILSPVTCASVLVVSCLGHCSERRGARSPRRAASGTRQRAVRVSERCASRRRLPRGAVQGTAASCTNPRADVPARHVPDAWPAVRPCVHAEGSARFAPAVRSSVRRFTGAPRRGPALGRRSPSREARARPRPGRSATGQDSSPLRPAPSVETRALPRTRGAVPISAPSSARPPATPMSYASRDRHRPQPPAPTHLTHLTCDARPGRACVASEPGRAPF